MLRVETIRVASYQYEVQKEIIKVSPRERRFLFFRPFRLIFLINLDPNEISTYAVRSLKKNN